MVEPYRAKPYWTMVVDSNKDSPRAGGQKVYLAEDVERERREQQTRITAGNIVATTQINELKNRAEAAEKKLAELQKRLEQHGKN